jgi:tripartite-type tricarboxylate transporter receptor subunit TctC
MKTSLAFLCLSFFVALSWAKTPVEFVVPHAPGGVSDITARIVDKGLPAGQYVVINKPGAGSQIAVNYIMQRPGMLLATSTQVFVSNLYTFKDLSYHPDRDLDIVATVGIIPSVLACNKKSEIRDLTDILNTNKSLSFAIGGYGSNEHLVTEVLFSMSKTRHRLVPFSSGGNSHAVALVGGHVDCMFANYPTIKSFISNSDLNVLITSHDGLDLGIKSWQKEFGRPFPLQSYIVIAVPAKMESNSKQEIRNNLGQALKNSEVREGLKNSGLFVQAGVDSADIKAAISANMSARKFIQTNQIDLLGK